MQSGDDWDDDWDDDESSSNLPTGLVTNMRIAIGASLVILLLLCSMIFTNFGLYSGAGSLSVLIDVNEGRDTSDKNFDFNILATSPAFGMLAKEGTYKISVLPSSINHTGGSVAVTSGKFTLNDEGRGSVTMPYSDVFTVNGDYTVQVECGSQKTTDSVSLHKYAETITAEVPLFNGEKPLDKDEGIIVNLQFLSEVIGQDRMTVIPWATGKITIYHSEEIFDSGKGEDYWDNDGSREPVAVEVIDFSNSGDVMTLTYESGNIDSNLPFILDTSEFYDTQGSGDYAMVIEFTNDLGSDTSLKTGQSFWKWFHVCQPDSNNDKQCDSDK
tara:strand:- start:59 stop:1042 length:984 start_codon:yes stop_codon:yes gene_type:complete